MKNREYIEQDFGDEACYIVRTYLEHHLETDKTKLSAIIDFDNKNLSAEIQLMYSLRIVRIGFYPDNGGQVAIFDYSIGKELIQYLQHSNHDLTGIFAKNLWRQGAGSRT